MSLTILLTNIALVARSGTEVVVEQLADGLRRRGHRPVVYAQQLGPLAEEMRRRGHLVIATPQGLPWRPDVIHGHHTAPTMAALAAHPGVPALFLCHDASSAFDAAPPHPRLRRIFAVDERCRARLVAEGVPAGQVALLRNAVELGRIPPRPPLPAQPARALVLSKHAAHLPALRQACAAAGLELTEYGAGPGRMTDQPEALFAEVDLVFATARTALEAAAAGAGVVVCDARGCAGFLTQARAAAWLPWNLGAGILAQPTDAAQVAAAIAEWSAPEATAASALVRTHCDLEAMLDQLETTYRELLAEPLPADPLAEAAAVGAFISAWTPHFDLTAPWRRLAEQVAPALPPLQAPLEPWAMAVRADVAALGEKIDALEGLQRQAGLAATLRRLWRATTPVALRAWLFRLRQRG